MYCVQDADNSVVLQRHEAWTMLDMEFSNDVRSLRAIFGGVCGENDEWSVRIDHALAQLANTTSRNSLKLEEYNGLEKLSGN